MKSYDTQTNEQEGRIGSIRKENKSKSRKLEEGEGKKMAVKERRSKPLTDGQIAYRKFLKTEFWKDLSATKKLQVGKCEECGATENLESHHASYPKDWFDSKPHHLKVLCRRHHREAHGIIWIKLSKIFPYREDERFNRFIYWADYLRQRAIIHGTPLKKSGVKYLRKAIACYPPTKTDRAMHFHTSQALLAGLRQRSFQFQ